MTGKSGSTDFPVFVDCGVMGPKGPQQSSREKGELFTGSLVVLLGSDHARRIRREDERDDGPTGRLSLFEPQMQAVDERPKIGGSKASNQADGVRNSAGFPAGNVKPL